MKCVVVCGGSVNNYTYIKKYFKGKELIVCADSGARHLREMNIIPDVLIGDFDSISEDDFEDLKAAGTKIVVYPPNKDYTDAHLAVMHAVEQGATEITIIAALGCRLDHTLANVQLLKWLSDKNISGLIADENNEAILVSDSVTIERNGTAYLSIIPLTAKVSGITTQGLLYPLENATIEMGLSVGISNEFTQQKAHISISGGLLLVIKSRD